MKKILFIFGFCLLFTLTDCQNAAKQAENAHQNDSLAASNRQNNDLEKPKQEQKEKYAGLIAELACQDTRDLIVKYAGSLIPVIGNAIMDKIISKKTGKGTMCECTGSYIKEKFMQDYQNEELERMIVNRKERSKIVKEVIIDKRKEILQCYKDSGTEKGLKLIERFLDKIAKNEAEENGEEKEE